MLGDGVELRVLEKQFLRIDDPHHVRGRRRKAGEKEGNKNNHP
jgi:hypothetical protein